MTIRIDHIVAKEVLLEEHQNSNKGITDELSIEWTARITRLSELCPYRKSSTFVAAIGTALLAKSVNPNVDVYCLLDRDGNENSYSARSLADNVWAKNRALLGVDLGANGANPLNNTPFIGKARIDEIKNVRNQEGYSFLEQCLDLLATHKSTAEARSALRGFINARKHDFTSNFSVGESAGDYLVLPTLMQAIHGLLNEGSEEGRCAQAVAAGLLASVFDEEMVDVGHVNDPDRNFPLDIVIYHHDTGEKKIRFAVEVKDKPIGAAEILSSVEKSIKLGVTDVVFLAISNRQEPMQFIAEYERSRDLGCKLIVYTEWESFIRACLTFSKNLGLGNLADVYRMIGNYLVDLGVSQKGVTFWESIATQTQNS